MSVAIPLHVHESLRKKDSHAFLYYDPEKGVMGFDNGCGQEMAQSIQYRVNENASRNALALAMFDIVRALTAQLKKDGILNANASVQYFDDDLSAQLMPLLVRDADGHALARALKTIEPAIEEKIALLDQSQFQAEAIGADLYLDKKTGEGDIASIWKRNECATEFIERMVNEAADANYDVDEDDLVEEVLARIDELLREGRELSPEQREFWDEKEEQGEVERLNEANPLRARPKPEGK